MSENLFEQPVYKPTLEELDGISGREIESVESRSEKFLHLEKGTDFEVRKKNGRVVSDRNLEDFIVFISRGSGTESKIVEAPHWRAINDSDVRSSIEISNPDGSVSKDHFYGVSTKGIGYLKPTVKGLNIEDYDSWAVQDKEGVNDRGYKVLGLISKEEVEGGSLVEKSERLIGLGLRTELYWGTAELKRLPFRGQMMTINEMRDKNIISPKKTYTPYEVVRLFKMNNRIAEASQSDERRLELFKKAFDVFNLETRDKGLFLPKVVIGNPELEKIFFEEFFKRMGKNMATLLNIGYDHGYMHSANVTLAAEIADVGTLSPWQKEKDKDKIKKYSGVRRSHLKDMRDMCYGLRMLLMAAGHAGLNAGDRIALQRAFFEGFSDVFDVKQIKTQKTDPTNAATWMEKIFDTVIVKGGHLPPLLHNEIEDWGISV